MIATPNRHKFTVDSLRLMEQAGVFPPDQRMELLFGEIIDMSPINAPHAHCVTYLTRFFYQYLSTDQYIISVQNPIQLSVDSLPQPDIVVAHFQEGIMHQHIQSKDIALLVEVSDSSYYYDRHTKSVAYALAGIAEYWIINLPQRQVEVYSQPIDDQYTQINIHQQAFVTSLGHSLDPGKIIPGKN